MDFDSMKNLFSKNELFITTFGFILFCYLISTNHSLHFLITAFLIWIHILSYLFKTSTFCSYKLIMYEKIQW